MSYLDQYYENYTSINPFMNGLDGRRRGRLRRWIGRTARQGYSAMTAAPRAIGALVTGNISDFQVFDDQRITDSVREQVAGQLVVGSIVIGAMGINAGTTPPTPSVAPPDLSNYGVPSINPELQILNDAPASQEAGISPLMLGTGALFLSGTLYYLIKN
jgi:hypothetical protein